MLNFVYGKDGWAHIRHDGEHSDVPLTEWAKAQCGRRGCGAFCPDTPEKIDMILCDCMMDSPDCPVAMAYCFAIQAVHLRSRLKLYEDTRLSPEQMRELTAPNNPLTLEELRKMDGEPVWIEFRMDVYPAVWGIVSTEDDAVWDIQAHLLQRLAFGRYGKTWLAYRRKLEDEIA